VSIVTPLQFVGCVALRNWKLDSRGQLPPELSAAASRWAFDSWEKLKNAADKTPARIVRKCPVKREQATMIEDG